MVAALRRPAGKVTPILSSLSLNARPPFFDLALHIIAHTSFINQSIQNNAKFLEPA